MSEMPIRPRLNLDGLFIICDNTMSGALNVLADPDYTCEDDILLHALQTLAKASECSQKLRALQIEYESKITDIMREVRDIADEIDSL